MMSTTETNAGPVAEALLAALSGQECTLVRDSYAEQLVVGFGTPMPADWPLRETMRTPWLLYSRYGKWQITDGVRQVASDDEPLNDTALQRARAVLLHQHVSDVKFDAASSALALTMETGARLELLSGEDATDEDDAWNLEVPGGLVIEAWPNRLAVTRRDAGGGTTTPSRTVVIHRLIRDVVN